jgi:uridine kinase
MIGDKLIYHSAYKEITEFVISELKEHLIHKDRICISVGGESGCGKTSLAYALQKDIEKSTGLRGFLFHLDDYFKLPPADNHKVRLNEMSLVGMNEVDLELLNDNLVQFKEGVTVLNKPLIDYHRNKILNERIFTTEFDFCVVEGTYVSDLGAPDYKIFIETTYLDTRKFRIERGRDLINDFNEQVLKIEHQIINPHYKLARVVIDKDLNIVTKT